MKIVMFVLLSLFFIPICLATTIETTVDVEIKEDLSFDLMITRNIDTNSWSNMDWEMNLGSELKNVKISDEKGDINLKKTENVVGYKIYTFDTHYTAAEGMQPIYVSSLDNNLIRINNDIYQLKIPMGVFKSEISDENVEIIITLPSSLSFLSSTGYDKKDGMKFSYNNPYSIFLFSFIKEKDSYIEIKDDNKIFFADKRVEANLREALRNKNLILNYPSGKNDFIVVGVSNTPDLDKKNVDVWGLYSADNLILIDDSLLNKDSNDVVSILLHELTHYANYFTFNKPTYPTWLEEGLGVYTEIKYDGGSRKPKIDVLEKWYGLGSSFSTVSLSKEELFPLYGFPVNYYSSVYGENILKSALNEIGNKKKAKEDFYGTVSDRELEIITSETLAAFAGVDESELFFPKKDIFLEDSGRFENVMKAFIADSSVEVVLIENNLEKDDAPSKDDSSFGTGTIIMMAVAGLAIILFIYIRIRR